MSVERQVEAFRSYLSERGLKFTRQRQAICDVVFNSNAHLTLNEILERAKEQHPSVGYATVYRTMKLMAEADMVHEHHFMDGYVRYEGADDEHHDHIICQRCGKIVEFEDERIEAIQAAIAEKLGFRVTGHRHQIYAECVPPCEARDE